MAHSDIRRFANIIGRRIDSPEIAGFLRTWGTHTKVGEIRSVAVVKLVDQNGPLRG